MQPLPNFEDCGLFRKAVNPHTDIVSYLLERRVALHQQGWYFTQKSMTDDGRFLLFCAFDAAPSAKRIAVVDLQRETIVFPDVSPFGGGNLPFLDTARGLLYVVRGEEMAIFDLAADPVHPARCVPLPMKELRKFGQDVKRFFTHLTLSPDHREALFDSRVDDRFVLGTFHLADGGYEFWQETPFHLNHAQFHPTDPDLAMGAWECSYTDRNGQTHRIHLVDGIYPRIWLLRRDGTRENIPPKINNYATHEVWAPDGRGIFYCGNSDDAVLSNRGKDHAPVNLSASGVFYHDLATGVQTTVVGHTAAHADGSRDNRCLTFDCMVGPWYRGCPWSVHFVNRETGMLTDICTAMPRLNRQGVPNAMHPDPHPHFVCHDRLIVYSCNDAGGRINVAVTPVDQLIEQTAVTVR